MSAFVLLELCVVLGVLVFLVLLQVSALASNRSKSKAMQCLNNVWQINAGTTLFAEENGAYPPLYRQPNLAGWPAWTYNSTNFVVQNANALWWPDALRLEGYVKDSTLFSCPQLTSPGRNIGGAGNSNASLGIGLNYPEIGLVASFTSGFKIRPSDVKSPKETVVFGDSGSLTTATKDLDSDAWVSDPGGGTVFFRSPSAGATYSTGDARMVPRHEGRVVAGWADGHVSLIKNSNIGWQYAKGNPLALWDR